MAGQNSIINVQSVQMDQQTLIEAITKAGGVLTVAAAAAGCSLRTIYNYRDKFDDVAQAIVAARESSDCQLLDIAESKLLLAVEDGKPWAIKFVLSTKGRSRGYGTKAEIEHKSNEVKQIRVFYGSATE